MEQILLKYKELFDVVYEKREKYPEENLSFFIHTKGSNYKGELMIVGRAVNGWNNQFNKNSLYANDPLSKVKSDLEFDDLDWVKDLWGPSKDGSYNTKKSAFWRTSLGLAKSLTTGSEFEIDSLVWTNLYKLSKAKAGNPSNPLINLQNIICQDLILEEIRLCKPEIVVFLTGYNWAKPFLSTFVKLPLMENSKYVVYVGRYENSLIIVGQHPQGKPEQEQINEIIEVSSLYKS